MEINVFVVVVLVYLFLKVAIHSPAEIPRIGHRDNLWLPAKVYQSYIIHYLCVFSLLHIFIFLIFLG